MTEQELVQQAMRGSDAAFERLVRLHEKKIYALCLRICGSAEDAQDAAQDAFVAAWRGLGSFRGEAAFSTWLYRLASNACVDILRRKKREALPLSLVDPDAAIEIRDETAAPERILERKETAALVGKALAALPEGYRAVLVLRELHQLSYTEIAEAMQLELGTVKSRISRGRLLMRNYLAASGNFFAAPPSKASKPTKGGVEE